MEWTSPRGHRERRREDTSSATLSRKRKAESVPDDESGSSVLSDELLVYLQPTSEDCVRLQEKGISSLKKLFDAVLATCRDQIRTGLPGVVIAVPRGMMLLWLRNNLSNHSRLQQEDAVRDGVLVLGGQRPKEWIGYREVEFRHMQAASPPPPHPPPPPLLPPPPAALPYSRADPASHRGYDALPPSDAYTRMQRPKYAMSARDAQFLEELEGMGADAGPQTPSASAPLSARDAAFLADLEGLAPQFGYGPYQPQLSSRTYQPSYDTRRDNWHHAPPRYY